MIIPPISLYKDYWPGIDETMPEVAAILNAVQKLVAIGEKNRLDLISKRNTVSRLQIQAAALQMKIDNLERLMSADAEIVDVWCIDYTLEIPVGTTIGTMETPGEATRLNIQRGYEEDDDTGFATALYNDVRDGIMQPVYASSLSGAAWFFNAAMKAAWQKWFPLFRYGKIVDMVDQEDGTRNATVALCPSTEASTILSGVHGLLSSGDINYIADPTGLKINQEDILYDVPFRYMNCDDVAFTVDDDVIIEFRELDIKQYKKGLVDKQIRIMDNHVSSVKTIKALDWVENGLGAARDWSQPVIVGFQHDPQPCDIMFLFYLIKDNDSENVRYGEEVIIDADYFDTHDEAPLDLLTIYIYDASGFYGQVTPLTIEYVEGSSAETSYWRATLSRKDTVVVSATVKEGKNMAGEPWLMPEGVYITVGGVPDCTGRSLFNYSTLYCAVWDKSDVKNQIVTVRTREDGFNPEWEDEFLEDYYPMWPGWVYSDPAHIGVKTAIYEYAVDRTIHNIKIPGDYHYYFKVWIDCDEGGAGIPWQDIPEGELTYLQFTVHFYDQTEDYYGYKYLNRGAVTVYKKDIDADGYIDVVIKSKDYIQSGYEYNITRPNEFVGFWMGINGQTAIASSDIPKPDYEEYSEWEEWHCETLDVQYPHIYNRSLEHNNSDRILPDKYNIHVPYYAYREVASDTRNIPEGVEPCDASLGNGIWYRYDAGAERYLYTNADTEGYKVVCSIPVYLRARLRNINISTAIIVKKYGLIDATEPCDYANPGVSLGGGSCSDGEHGDAYCDVSVMPDGTDVLKITEDFFDLLKMHTAGVTTPEQDTGDVLQEFTVDHVARRYELLSHGEYVGGPTCLVNCVEYWYCYYYWFAWYSAPRRRDHVYPALGCRGAGYSQYFSEPYTE